MFSLLLLLLCCVCVLAALFCSGYFFTSSHFIVQVNILKWQRFHFQYIVTGGETLERRSPRFMQHYAKTTFAEQWNILLFPQSIM